MDKETEIQEMADIVEIYCSNHFDEEVCENPYKSDCDKCIYCALVEAGYHKADEVRKETAKEILQELKPIWELIGSGSMSDEDVFFEVEEMVAKKYEVEIKK